MFEAYLEVLETGYWEVTFAFEGLADEHVWKRPAEGLLSVGELAGHCAYWDAMDFAGEAIEGEPGSVRSRVSSPLVDRRFRYYPATIAEPPSADHLAMTAEQVRDELLRVHKESVAHLRALNPIMTDRLSGIREGFTWGELLKYKAFHIAYHTGQMYSARHLLGEEPPDN